MCASIRRASRALSQVYEDGLRPSGLRVTQFTILQALSLAGEVKQAALGEILALDSTTLTRTLDIMLRHHWITRRRGEDRRESRIQLSKSGEAQFRRALPYWRKVQQQMQKQLGAEVCQNLLQLTTQIARTVAE